jgi:ABC-type uncharacterized transport system permease subunit
VIRVELVKMLRRPRTWVTIAMLNALPTLVAVLLACRYVATGFMSLLWAVATLRWWLIPTALVLAFVTKRATGNAR